MNRRTFVKTLPAVTVLAGTTSGFPQDLQPINLMKPQKDGGKSVLAALEKRRTIRSISSRELPAQVLSNLLWAAFGVNREKASFGKPGRTAASASNSQEIDLYVAMARGVYLYEAVPHRLTPVVRGDFRARAGRGSAAKAPVNIFYVVDLTRYITADWQPDPHIGDPEVQKSYYYVATGLIDSNVYLFAASQGLAAWFHNCNRDKTAREFKLRPQQRMLFAQTIGYPD
ncbi:MAG: SagB/ThcOx family dehydrogenase [Candidatus Aminicenantes bacterium]|nr:SagB/ThcOx family dehydrogenase [Candidatus Aminicenantes bacterium]NIM79898.1 SagB/ThcOx family dehydrogenase [Candidatus Aminicenantes bacterium]NIN19235.1 SagB/ThcOx family dehydrogenase [Candidatus Aminicenantes bacterium]NIN43140.1 SagB/ThcOx family dehydrogenase [Candidatus Aminicenantes bacterium]NIN85877.1 SagB/ThcOx family dehydrogenase [Candidatus Aminicenantes bacterium]